MKNFYLLPILLFLSCSQVSNNETIHPTLLDKNGNPITQIKFDYYEIHSGEIEEGTIVEYEFPFTNVGNIPLEVINFRSNCGCVVPICDRGPYEPGESGIFYGKFDTKGKRGVQYKNLTLTTNTEPSNTVLKMYATIIPRNK